MDVTADTPPRRGPLARLLAGYGRLTLFLIPIGIATNFIGGQIASLLKLPMHLDSIGTILVGALCGGLPGALVGLLSNLINAITAPPLLPYALVSILLGLAAGLFSRIGALRTAGKAALTVIPFGLIGGGVGSLITIVVFGGLGSSGVSIIIGALHALGLDLKLAVFVSTLPTDFLDKALTVAVVVLILRRIPTRILVKVPLGPLYLHRPRRRATLTVPHDDLALEL
ncbi:hypothetical protein [Brachybacterium hainanense]|uniref:ECF transporter S component n=1 Tax=Brachybacterium hainanense TaxID=1541174 RepID=A0ABV6R8A1_9MICO